MALKSYHSCAFPGRTGPALVIPEKQPLVGIEFETEIRGRNALTDAVDAHFADKDVRFYPESDGSLSDTHGVEFVSSPMRAQDAISQTGPFKALLDIIGDNETLINNSRVGMHVNVSARSGEHAWATAVYGNLLAGFSRRVAGRGDVYSTHADKIMPYVPNRETYGKNCAVATRMRSIFGEPWTCPTTHITLPPLPGEAEWRNEFRANRSTTVFECARVQIRYCVLMSQFALVSLPILRDMNIKTITVPSATFRTDAEAAFLSFVKSRARDKAGITSQLYELLTSPTKCIWSLAEPKHGKPWVENKINTHALHGVAA